MTTFAPNTQFGKYRILRLLGQGGMAAVYEAEDMQIGRTVALKVLPPAFARDEERASLSDVNYFVRPGKVIVVQYHRAFREFAGEFVGAWLLKS